MILWRAALAAATVLRATPAEAHAFGARYDLPLPLELYLAAAGMAVAASFFAALLFLRTGRARTLHLDLPVPARAGHALSTAQRRSWRERSDVRGRGLRVTCRRLPA